MAASSKKGVIIGKMIPPQSIDIGAAAANSLGCESKLLNQTVKFSAAFIIIAGCITYFGSKVY
ncbi:L-lactate permease [Clostridium sp. WB02_MRS01]|uniref:L-lactate permease n=1 Tax=Clostridium sp. WB02_MRS01 TaxID=2605777 RepID=UPI0012B27898